MQKGFFVKPIIFWIPALAALWCPPSVCALPSVTHLGGREGVVWEEAVDFKGAAIEGLEPGLAREEAFLELRELTGHYQPLFQGTEGQGNRDLLMALSTEMNLDPEIILSRYFGSPGLVQDFDLKGDGNVVSWVVGGVVDTVAGVAHVTGVSWIVTFVNDAVSEVLGAAKDLVMIPVDYVETSLTPEVRQAGVEVSGQALVSPADADWSVQAEGSAEEVVIPAKLLETAVPQVTISFNPEELDPLEGYADGLAQTIRGQFKTGKDFVELKPRELKDVFDSAYPARANGERIQWKEEHFKGLNVFLMTDRALERRVRTASLPVTFTGPSQGQNVRSFYTNYSYLLYESGSDAQPLLILEIPTQAGADELKVGAAEVLSAYFTIQGYGLTPDLGLTLGGRLEGSVGRYLKKVPVLGEAVWGAVEGVDVLKVLAFILPLAGAEESSFDKTWDVLDQGFRIPRKDEIVHMLHDEAEEKIESKLHNLLVNDLIVENVTPGPWKFVGQELTRGGVDGLGDRIKRDANVIGRVVEYPIRFVFGQILKPLLVDPFLPKEARIRPAKVTIYFDKEQLDLARDTNRDQIQFLLDKRLVRQASVKQDIKKRRGVLVLMFTPDEIAGLGLPLEKPAHEVQDLNAEALTELFGERHRVKRGILFPIPEKFAQHGISSPLPMIYTAHRYAVTPKGDEPSQNIQIYMKMMQEAIQDSMQSSIETAKGDPSRVVARPEGPKQSQYDALGINSAE